ncbi:MAG: SusC/RagA family TonB-linked outer membrane protein [Saprospiraceae bacterium]
MKKFTLLLLMLFSITVVMAQRTITGIVFDDTGEALIGANVLVKESTLGTITDVDGNFTLEVPDGASFLIISFTGYETQEYDISNTNNVSITLSQGEILDEIVVTALGIKRTEKALGYSVQQVKGDEISRSGASSAVDALVGKASGVQITRSSGSVGGGSRIVIRGVTSMTGNNQPLIVIDGVRTNNQTLLSQAGTAGTAASNRLMDLNPDDIESMNILKGAAATALYGTAGASGVVVITTKKGALNQQFDVNFSSSVSFDNITQMIDLQNIFAQGRLDGNGVPFHRDPSTGESGSWGPNIANLEYSNDPNHPNAPGASAFNAEGQYKFDRNGFLVPKGTGDGVSANTYNNVDPFFKTGNSFTNSIAISGGGKAASFRLSLSDLRATGVVPREKYDRKTVKLASTLRPVEGLTISGSVNYTKSDYVRVQQGSNTSGLLLGMLRTPISFDNTNGFSPADAVDENSTHQFSDFRQRNYRGGGGYDNPYWIINKALGVEDVNRTFGNVNVEYQFNNWATVGVNVGYDLTSDSRKQDFEIGSRTNTTGRIRLDEFNTQQFDYVFTLVGNGQVNDDFGVSYLLGANIFSYNNNRTNVIGTGLVFPGFLDISNATQVTSFQNVIRNSQVGFVGQIEGSYRNMIYLTASARQDYDSRLGNPEDFQLSQTGFFYPSVSSSFIFSELMNDNSVLSLGKLRFSWAQVGSPPPNSFSTQSVFVSPLVGDGWGPRIGFPIAGQSGFDQAARLGNPNLTPELTTTIEVGVDLRFLKGRLGLDATYYNGTVKDAILPASLPRSTGFQDVWLNAGEMTSKGIEITLSANPVRTSSFDWTTQVNFTKSENIVTELAPGIERLFLAGFNSAGSYLVKGNQYGAIFGGAYLREGAGGADDTSLNIPGGAVVINDNPNSSEYGYQAVDPTQRAIGNPNPDFIVGWNNSFTVGRISANFLLDWRQGGDLWNGTAWALSFFGRSQFTAETRVESPTAIEGVLSDGTPNNIPVVRDRNYWTSSLGGFGSVGEQFVQDGGWVRLREVGVSYSLPKTKAFKGGSIGISGRNLWFNSAYDGIDPETSLTGTGNGQGFDYFNMPSTKSVIVKLSVDF